VHIPPPYRWRPAADRDALAHTNRHANAHTNANVYADSNGHDRACDSNAYSHEYAGANGYSHYRAANGHEDTRYSGSPWSCPALIGELPAR
jgi:hypothetical protein